MNRKTHFLLLLVLSLLSMVASAQQTQKLDRAKIPPAGKLQTQLVIFPSAEVDRSV